MGRRGKERRGRGLGKKKGGEEREKTKKGGNREEGMKGGRERGNKGEKTSHRYSLFSNLYKIQRVKSSWGHFP